MVKSKVIQWGNSLAIKLPKYVREMTNLTKDDELDVYITDKKEIVIRKSDGNPIYDDYTTGNILN